MKPGLPRLVATLLVGLVAIGPGRAAGAHGLLLESIPGAGETTARGPSRIELRFNVRIEPTLSALRLTGPEGTPIPLPSDRSGSAGPGRLIAELPSLEPGSYTVHWRILASDGHLSHGRFSFAIGKER